MQNITVKEVLYKTVHRNKKTVIQIADETGISSNYLYRACLPDDASGVKFPLDYLLPVMKSTNDYSVLKHIARISGFLTIRMPVMKADKGEEIDIVDKYQGAALKALNALRIFFENPTSINYQIVDKALVEIMEKSASAQKYAEKKLLGQLEMEM